MLTILLCVLIAAYAITLSIASYNKWRVYNELPLGKTLIRVSLLVLAIMSLPLVSNIDEELEKNSAEITRVTVTNTETNETLLVLKETSLFMPVETVPLLGGFSDSFLLIHHPTTHTLL